MNLKNASFCLSRFPAQQPGLDFDAGRLQLLHSAALWVRVFRGNHHAGDAFLDDERHARAGSSSLLACEQGSRET